jgi:hypothetical protein
MANATTAVVPPLLLLHYITDIQGGAEKRENLNIFGSKAPLDIQRT